MDESNATCGKRLDSVGVDNTETNRRAYRELLLATPGLGKYISGAIMFEETLYQSCQDGTSFVDKLNQQGIVPGKLAVLPQDSFERLLHCLPELLPLSQAFCLLGMTGHPP